MEHREGNIQRGRPSGFTARGRLQVPGADHPDAKVLIFDHTIRTHAKRGPGAGWPGGGPTGAGRPPFGPAISQDPHPPPVETAA